MANKLLCFVDKESTCGRGHYYFTYLGKTRFLCGHHANKVMKYIEKLRKDE